MYKTLFFSVALFVITPIHWADAVTETKVIKVLSDVSDGVIVTGPYPGSWSDQYDDSVGRYIWSDNFIAFPYTSVYDTNGGWLGIHRAFLAFDTSTIPTNAVIDSAKLVVTTAWVADEVNDQYSYMNVFQGRQASPTNLSLDDIEMCGDSLESPTAGSANIDISDISVNTPLMFTLNQDGLGWVKKGEYTKLCLREGHDTENKEFINNQNFWQESGIGFYTAENSDETLRPYLEVTYTVDGPEEDVYELLHELIDTVSGYAFPKQIVNAYMANLKKIETFLLDGKYGSAENQIDVFLKKIEHDYAKEKISEAQYSDLRNRGEDVRTAISNL